ncbi:MAG: hypothetical protein AAGF31_03205 [Planctomycetota bacterium]
MPTVEWNRLARADRRIAIAKHRGWHGAASRLLPERRGAMDQLRWALEEPPTEAVTTLGPRDILLDLETLAEEFPCLEIDLQHRQVQVTTEPIELEGMALGPFEISLDWRQIEAVDQPYSVVALDPHPAANGDTVHPHLAGRSLREGEGRAAIRAALQAGRLLDFFVLVRQVLSTYNSASAYVELEHWEGLTCVDCGDWLAANERHGCEICSADLCSSCLAECESCGRYRCYGCRGECSECDDCYCSDCLNAQVDDEGRCEACQPTDQPQGEADATKTTTASQASSQALRQTLSQTAATATHSLRMGQTPASA